MDPSTRLDHAVFQLSPTRSRCDLLVCSGKGVYDKIASGLLEPFLSHLRCAREQIPKGGYSFTLRPPTTSARAAGPGGGGDPAAAAPPPWFTKGILERFVRFVSTPDILERVAAIEKEILHIESCVHSASEEFSSPPPTENGACGTGKAEHQGSAGSHSSGDDSTRKLTSPPKLKAEANGHDATHGENSKLRLQQALETRKAVLLKEQGMAYARAAVAGYDMANIDDFMSFADAFGASRLREACINFKDLCKKKEKDKIWMDELAAIGTYAHSELSYIGTSGVMLTGDPVTNDRPELNGTFSNAVSDPNAAVASSDGGQDNHGQTSNREPWISASNGIYHEKHQIPIGWPSHPSQYMYSFQTPPQQMPPYQGFAFPGALPPYFPGQFDNAQQPPFKEASASLNHSKPAKTKEARSVRSTSRSRDGEGSHDSSGSGSELDGQIHHDASPEDEVPRKRWGNKRSNKKSSRTVVIRNINFISSERKDGEDGSTGGSSDEDDINESFLKENVEDIVDSLGKYHKTSHYQHKKKGNRNRKNIQGDNTSQDQNAEIDTDANVCKDAKGDEGWQALQSILMRDESASAELHGGNNIIPTDSNEQSHLYSGDDSYVIKNSNLATSTVHNFPLGNESLKGTRQRPVAADPIATNAKDDNCQSNCCSEIFDCDENYSTRMKRSHNADEELLFSEKSKSQIVTPNDITAHRNETSIRNLQRDADWFIASKSRSLQDGEPTGEYSMFEGDQNLKYFDGVRNEKTRKELPILDDSFVVATRPSADEHPTSQWEADMSIISDLAISSEIKGAGVASNSIGNNILLDNHEPDDLQMILERDTGSESVGASWIPEIDYAGDITFNTVKESDSVFEANGPADVNISPNPKRASSEGNPKNKHPGKDAKPKPLHGYLSKAKSEVMSRNKKPSVMSREQIQRNKLMKEEENRKRMEDLLAQRQRRIAERSSSSGENKPGTGSSKHEKKTPRSAIQGSNRPSLPHGMEVTSLGKKATCT